MSLDLIKGVWKCQLCNIGGGILDFERLLTGRTVAECWAAINATIGREERPAENADRFTTYDYHDRDGNVVYQVLRWELPGEKKKFSQRRPNGSGGWIANMDGVTRVPFNLPGLLKAEVVLIAEGEKDALNLEAAVAGFPTGVRYAGSTSVGGAGKWRDEYSPWFKGKKIVIFGDNDAPGRGHVAQVAKSLAPYATSLQLVDLPELKEHGDVSDYLTAHTPHELFALMQAAPVWNPGGDKQKQLQMDACEGLPLRRGTEIVPRKQGWTVPNFIPNDTLVLLVAVTGLGKTRVSVQWAAHITAGRVPVIGGRCMPRNILLLSNEDSEAHLRELFVGFGGDLSRLHVMQEDADLIWTMGNTAALDAQMTPSGAFLGSHRHSRGLQSPSGQI